MPWSSLCYCPLVTFFRRKIMLKSLATRRLPRWTLGPALIALTAVAASASTLVTPVPGLGTVTVTTVYSLVDGSLLGGDIRGTTLANVSDPTVLGDIILTDGGGSPPFGNT